MWGDFRDGGDDIQILRKQKLLCSWPRGGFLTQSNQRTRCAIQIKIEQCNSSFFNFYYYQEEEAED